MALTELLNIKYPIIQGSMAAISKHELVAAVSNAGGLGVLTSVGFTPDSLRQELGELRYLTKKPFGVNLMLQQPNINDLLPVLITNHVPVVFTGAGTPAPFMDSLLNAGIKVIPVIPNVKIAQKMAEIGATAVVAEGMESGGHIGTETTMTLVPQVVNAVDIPVIAGGGIANGKTIAAALAMGAAGVQMGTVFLAAEETPISDYYKKLIVAAKDTDTTVTGSGANRVRSLKTPMIEKVLELTQQHAEPEKIAALTDHSLAKAIDGDVVNGSFMAGQIAGVVDAIKPAAQIVEELWRDAMIELTTTSRTWLP
jgi:enoyl-[acyl-carrier protein] reductase II